MKQIVQDIKPYLPLILGVATVGAACLLLLFGFHWRWIPGLFGYPLPMPVPDAV